MKDLDGLMQPNNLILKTADLSGDLLKVFRVLEVVGAAVGCVQARKVEVATSLARRFSIAFYFSAFAFIAISQRSARWFVSS